MRKSVFSQLGHSSTIVARARAVRMSPGGVPEAQGARHSGRTEGLWRGLSARRNPRRGKRVKELQKMASDPAAPKTSAVQKLAEFARLKYPSKLLWTACTTMGVNTRDPTWFRVREKIPSA